MKIVAAIAVVLGMFAFSAQHSDADAHGKKYRKHTHYTQGVKPQVRGYIARGGYAYDYDFEHPLDTGIYGSRNSSSDLTIWERVNTDPRSTSNTVSASGL